MLLIYILTTIFKIPIGKLQSNFPIRFSRSTINFLIKNPMFKITVNRLSVTLSPG